MDKDQHGQAIRAGLAAARQRGTKLGRPTGPVPDVARILELRALGMSVADVAVLLSTSPKKVREALAAAAKK